MRVIILIASLALVAACQSDEPVVETETVVAETAETTTLEPQPITEPIELVVSDTDQPSLLESAELRVAGSAEGGEEIETASSGEELEVLVVVKQVPEGLAAWVHWLGPDGEMISEEQKEVPANRSVAFRTGTEGWAPGEYSAEVYIGGDLVEVKTFRLTAE